jgi:transposase-like protein
MDFPIIDLLDEDACYAKLVQWLHPDGLACPRCGARQGLQVHRRQRAPVLDYRCGHCRRVFNAFTGTALHGTRRRPAELVLIVRGIAQGVPTAQLARELGRDRSQLLDLRHRWQEAAHAGRHRMPLDDTTLEADEMYQNAGEKRSAAPRPRRPAAASRQQASWAWELGQRPAAGLRRRGAAERRGPADGGTAPGRGDAAAGGAACELADGDRLHRRVAGL